MDAYAANALETMLVCRYLLWQADLAAQVDRLAARVNTLAADLAALWQQLEQLTTNDEERNA